MAGWLSLCLFLSNRYYGEQGGANSLFLLPRSQFKTESPITRSLLSTPNNYSHWCRSRHFDVPMRLSTSLLAKPIRKPSPFLHLARPSKLAPNVKRTHGVRFPVVLAAGSTPGIPSASARSSAPVYKSNIDSDPSSHSGSNSGVFPNPRSQAEAIEEDIEKVQLQSL